MTTLNLQVSTSDDDCYRRLTSSHFIRTDPTYPAGDYADSTYDYQGGSRFLNVTIGQGDTIDAASLQLRAADIFGAIPTTYIEGEDADDAVAFVNDGGSDYDGRARTTAVVSWTPSAWVNNTWYTTSEIKTVIQEIVDRAGWVYGNDLVTFWRDAAGWGGTKALIRADSYDANAARAPRLDIDYTEPFITGQAVLSGVGSMAVTAAVTIPAKVAMSGVGTMVVAGTKGTIKLGQVALSGVGSMTSEGVITASGKASMSGVGSMAVAGRRIFTGEVAMSGVGSMSVIGEVAGLLEGRAVLSGVGSMSVIGQRIVGGKVSISGAGSMTVAAAITLAGKVAMSGVGTMTVIGVTGVVSYTPYGKVLRGVDPDNFPTDTQFYLEVIFKGAPPGKTVYARFFNLTDAIEVADSEITSTETMTERVRSPALTLASGSKDYRVEFGGLAGSVYLFPASADLVTKTG